MVSSFVNEDVAMFDCHPMAMSAIEILCGQFRCE